MGKPSLSPSPQPSEEVVGDTLEQPSLAEGVVLSEEALGGAQTGVTDISPECKSCSHPNDLVASLNSAPSFETRPERSFRALSVSEWGTSLPQNEVTTDIERVFIQISSVICLTSHIHHKQVNSVIGALRAVVRVILSQQLALAEGFEPQIIAALERRCENVHISTWTPTTNRMNPLVFPTRFPNEGILGTFRDEMQVGARGHH